MPSGTTTVTGISTGIDWETTIQQLMAIERRKTVLLEDRKSENSTKLNLWAQIQSKVMSLQSAAEKIDRRSEFAVKSASSSDSTTVGVSVDASAAPGAHSVEVLRLARAHRLAAQGWADKNSTGVGDSGGDFVISINGETITVADADLSSATTLEQLVNLINNDAENAGKVTASMLDDGSGSNRYRLVLSAAETGADNAISVTSNPTALDFSANRIDTAETETGWTGTSAITTAGTYSGTTNKTFTFTVAGSGTQTLGAADITLDWVDSTGATGSIVVPNGYSGSNITVAEGVQLSFAAGNLVAGQSFDVDVFSPELTAAQDAMVRIDGVYMNKASNTVDDVFTGVTFNLLAADAGNPVDVTIANDNAGVRAQIEDFVNAYNSVVGDLATFSRYDDKNEVAAPLLGDGFLSSIRQMLGSVAASAVTGLPDDSLYDSLAVAGIKTSTNGLLTIDSSKLDDALSDHFEDVADLFTKSFTTSDSRLFFVSDSERSLSGDYAIVANYDASGNLTSATINGQAATVDGNLITGVEGTAHEGLVIGWNRVSGAPGSASTTVRFGKGIAGEFAAHAIQILDSESGQIHFAQENLNDNIESLDRQIEAWDLRLAAVEQRLRDQFSRLETAMSKMQNQSSYISSVLG
ncbi:flagellar filament capping protein FliD [candidate division KSB1 bacterium]|nr:flagellar filament capping protein FliD [candidate division KSB1 bacterium]